MKLVCSKCGHTWTQKTDKKPVSCPRCKSYTWDKNNKEEGTR